MIQTMLKQCLKASGLILALFFSTLFSHAAPPKVLYVTQEPGRFHDYTKQKAFVVTWAEEAGWDLTIETRSYEEQVAWLRTKDYGKGYDAIIYNFCFALTRDIDSCANVIHQTRENGVPAMLIHCAMHSWWATYKKGTEPIEGEPKEVKADKELLEAWKTANPDKPFPVWGSFTGVASTAHGPKVPITLKKCCDHPALANVPDEFTTSNAELYNNYYVLDKVVPLLKGTQEDKEAIVMWECPQGKSKVIGLTTGHALGEWEDKEFKHLIVDGVNSLLKK